MTRRRFLKNSLKAAALAGAAPLLGGAEAALAPVEGRKLIIVFFGGGTRSSESVDDPQHRFIPHLWNQMVPEGTLFTDVRVKGTVVHPNCVGSALTGHVEWDHLDWTRPLAHPTLFEIFRRQRGASDLSAWAFMYASILAKAAESSAEGYGPAYSANVVMPPTIPRHTAEEMDHLLRQAAAQGQAEAELEAARRCAALARASSRISSEGLRSEATRAFLDREYAAWKASQASTSHDLFLAERAISAMKAFTPDVLVVAFGEIDCAHYGSWSRYVEAIARTDALTWRLWQAAQQLPAYRQRTLMLIQPDHGRQLDAPGGMGFIHHSDFYSGADLDEGCQRIWLLALGAGVQRGQRIAHRIPNTALAATGLEYLGLSASSGATPSVLRQIQPGRRN